MCRPHATSSWASRGHSAQGSTCWQPSTAAVDAAHCPSVKCLQALKHLDSRCWLGTDQCRSGVGLAPQPWEQLGARHPITFLTLMRVQKDRPAADGKHIPLLRLA